MIHWTGNIFHFTNDKQNRWWLILFVYSVSVLIILWGPSQCWLIPTNHSLLSSPFWAAKSVIFTEKTTSDSIAALAWNQTSNQIHLTHKTLKHTTDHTVDFSYQQAIVVGYLNNSVDDNCIDHISSCCFLSLNICHFLRTLAVDCFMYFDKIIFQNIREPDITSLCKFPLYLPTITTFPTNNKRPQPSRPPRQENLNTQIMETPAAWLRPPRPRPLDHLQPKQLRRRRRREQTLYISLLWGREKGRDPAATATTRTVWLEMIVPGVPEGKGKKEGRRKVVGPRGKAKVESPRTTIATELYERE